MNIKSCRWGRQRNVISVDKHSILKMWEKKVQEGGFSIMMGVRRKIL